VADKRKMTTTTVNFARAKCCHFKQKDIEATGTLHCYL